VKENPMPGVESKPSSWMVSSGRIRMPSLLRHLADRVPTHGGASYLSQNDLRLHFGLGTAKKMESVEIRWPNGKVETLENVAADAIYMIVEGSGIRNTTPLPPPAGGATNGAH